MLAAIIMLFSTAIFLIIRELQKKYNSALVARRALNIKSIKIPGRTELFKIMIKTIARLNSKLPVENYRKKIQNKLIECKAVNDYTPDEYLAYKEVMILGGGIIYMALFGGVDLYFAGILLGLSIYPDLQLREKKEKYEKDVLRELPFFLDVLAVCVEAGLTFDNAIMKYLSKAKPSVFRGELEKYIKDVKIGKQRSEALKDISLRINLQDFSSFISSITQSERLGTSIASTLRLQTQQIRVKRVQRIEKQARQAPVKLMLPLILFIFPVIFIVIFGPIVIRLVKAL
jgi:tight adherence protein C